MTAKIIYNYSIMTRNVVYMGTMEHFLHFGVGKENIIRSAEIMFPSGKSIFLKNTKTNQVITIYEYDAESNLFLRNNTISGI